MEDPSTDTASIERVVAQVQDGDVEAFAQIIRRYQQAVWRIASFALRDQAATEDLAQQVFVSVYEHLGSYERGRDFGAWLRTIARNQVRASIGRIILPNGKPVK